jgi:hypothetical protein
MSYNVRPPAGSSTLPVSGHAGTPAPLDPTVIDAAKDTFIGTNGEPVKLAGTGPVANPILTAHKPNPEEVRVVMNVLFAAANLLLPHFDEPNSEGGNPTPPRR